MIKVFRLPALRRTAIGDSPLSVVTRRVVIWRGGLTFQVRYTVAVLDRATGVEDIFIRHYDKAAALEGHAAELELRRLFP